MHIDYLKSINTTEQTVPYLIVNYFLEADSRMGQLVKWFTDYARGQWRR